MSFHEEKRLDGSVLFIGGSVGNEDYVKKYAKEIGSDVVAICHLSVTEASPIKDASGKVVGSHVLYVLDTDVSGTLPDFVKSAIG